MATPVSDIYDLFLSQIGKDLMLEMADDIVEELLMTYLLGATVEFSLICKKDLTIENNYIRDDLTLDETKRVFLAFKKMYPNLKTIIPNFVHNWPGIEKGTMKAYWL